MKSTAQMAFILWCFVFISAISLVWNMMTAFWSAVIGTLIVYINFIWSLVEVKSE